MSSIFHADIRERWRSRSMILKKWLVGKFFDPSLPVCEVEVEGVSRIIHGKHSRFGPDDAGNIYHAFVKEGNEISPSAELFECTDSTFTDSVRRSVPNPAEPIQLHSRAKLQLTRRERYPRIFINYRRDDADAYAGRLHEVLAQNYGEDEVFLAEFSIRGGEVWDWTIQQAVVHAEVMLALIGRRWLAQEDNQRRIDSQTDMVRREIVAAMDRGMVVIPVLLPEATIPRSDNFDYKDELRLLPQLQFHRLAGARHWKSDVAELLTTIEGYLKD